jgi:L-serine dehydratase
MRLSARDDAGALLLEQTYYSTGRGFFATEKQLRAPAPRDQIATGRSTPFPFGSGAELLEHCARAGKTIEEVVYANEDAMRPRAETDARLDRIVAVMSRASSADWCARARCPARCKSPAGRRRFGARCNASRWRTNLSAYSIGSTSTPWP